MSKLLPFQQAALDELKKRKKCAIYYGLGLGKTFMGAAKLMDCKAKFKLIVCQKSKINDWVDHMTEHYGKKAKVFNLRVKDSLESALLGYTKKTVIAVVNYDLLCRMVDKININAANKMAVCFDESSMIKNPKALRSKAALKLKADELILLSGTPVGGKYEELYTQIKLLGWNITYEAFEDRYIKVRHNVIRGIPFPIKQVVGYKNVDELKAKLREHGAIFKRSEEVLDLPESIDTTIKVDVTEQYLDMKKEGVCSLDGDEFITASTPLSKLTIMRQLCSSYNENKKNVLADLLESTEDRVIIFYNYWKEFEAIRSLAIKLKRPFAFVNGKDSDLGHYKDCSNSIIAVQYKAGATGLNLQLANKMVFYSPELSSELFEQAKGRIRRMGQSKSCFYWYLTCADLEEKIYKTLKTRADYTLELFKDEFGESV